MFAIISSNGVMSAEEIQTECREQQWIPIFVYRPKDFPNSPPIVPLFEVNDVAKRFIDRNLQKDWVKGAISLTDEDIEAMKSKGWKIEPLDWHRKINGNPEFEIGFEIIEISDQPDMLCIP